MIIFKKEQFKKLTGLEALDSLIDYGEWLPAYEMEIIRRELKTLEIIKRELKHFIDFENNSKCVYIDGMISCENKEEFDLLKEELL